MKKLYKFFGLLLGIFLVVSFIYGVIISWITFKAIQAMAFKSVDVGKIPIQLFLQPALIQGLLYGLVLLLMVIYLLNKSFQNGQRFTVRNIIRVTLWFYAVTTSVYILHILCYPGGWVIGELLLKMGARFFLPPYLWFPFPIAWIALTVILASQIKKTE